MSNPWQIQTTQFDRTNSEGNTDYDGYGRISILLSKYVLKENGKGLSTKNFSDILLALAQIGLLSMTIIGHLKKKTYTKIENWYEDSLASGEQVKWLCEKMNISKSHILLYLKKTML